VFTESHLLLPLGAVVVSVLLGLATHAHASYVEEVPLWDGLAPGTEGRQNEECVVNERVQKTYQPAITAHLPPHEFANGTGILICPGGGYRHLAIHKEGHQVADWLNTLGVAGFVLKYRLDREEALQDARRALSLIRTRAEEYHLEPDRIGVLGFSAGGHLAVNLATHYGPGRSGAGDAVDRTSCRPDFMVPVYVSVRGLDLQALITPESPPAFIVGATDDHITPPENSIALYRALVAVGVPAELHLYEHGGHGFGLAKRLGPVSAWTTSCENWLRKRDLLYGNQPAPGGQ